MKVDYIDLSEYDVQFKQLISGPAPVGRILNYVILTGKGVLRHKNGNRDLSLKDNIASAWCSEFMVGLGLVKYYDEPNKTIYNLHLTEQGKSLYNLIRDYKGTFNEDPSPVQCKKELLEYSQEAYDLVFKIFKTSPICINLCRYIQNSGTNSFSKATFKDDYFECFKVLYEGGTYNRNARTTTGDNRVPSLLQICEFFGCMTETSDRFVFNVDELSKITSVHSFIKIDEKRLLDLAKEDEYIEKYATDLAQRYGIDGTISREVVIRNSALQKLFRNNLLAKYGCRCAICNKEIETVLIASHIVPASESNVEEKADCENGLLLCALHDKLFDKYLISFDFCTGKIIYTDELKDLLQEYQLSEDTFLDNKYLTEERKNYLMRHNFAFYERNK